MKNVSSKIIIWTMILFAIVYCPLSVDAQVRPIYDRGAMGLGQILKKLQTTASIMHTGAHPDDEDSGLLAYLARKEQARTVYLSLTRGDGGQNVIGEELFEPLGVIRSEELLQARALDGGEQMFTRVMDYGYSKKRSEAAGFWGEKLTLGDMVRAIRVFRPFVIISRFSGTPADGHGQHQFAGYLTPIAYKAAADPTMFPEHMKEGLRPWQAKKLYMGRGFRPNPNNTPTLFINTGEYDDLLGRSYLEVALEGRSQHKSQEMGLIENRGTRLSGMRLMETFGKKTEKESGIFDGLDISISGIAKLTNNQERAFQQNLQELQASLAKALSSYNQYRPQDIIPHLAKAHHQIVTAFRSTTNKDSKFILEKKQKEIEIAIRMASGVVVDVLSDTEMLVAGRSAKVSVKIFAPERTKAKIKKVQMNVPDRWSATTAETPPAPKGRFARFFTEQASHASYFDITASENAKLTQPYWLENPRNPNFTFNWDSAGDSKNMPFQAPNATADVTMENRRCGIYDK